MTTVVPRGKYEAPASGLDFPIAGDGEVIVFANASPLLSLGNENGIHTCLGLFPLYRETCEGGSVAGLVTPEKTTHINKLREIFEVWSTSKMNYPENGWTKIDDQHLFTDLVPQHRLGSFSGQDIINSLIERVNSLKTAQTQKKVREIASFVILLHELPIDVQVARMVITAQFPSTTVLAALPTFVQPYDIHGRDKGVRSWTTTDNPVRKTQ